MECVLLRLIDAWMMNREWNNELRSKGNSIRGGLG